MNHVLWCNSSTVDENDLTMFSSVIFTRSFWNIVNTIQFNESVQVKLVKISMWTMIDDE